MDQYFGNKLKQDFSHFNMVDDSGNKMHVDANGRVYISLASERRDRHIGTLLWKPLKTEPHKRVLIFFKEEKEENVFRKTNAWSIPHEILNKVYGVVVVTEYGEYKITRDAAMQNGSYLHFKTTGVERKIYIPKEFFKIKTHE